MLSSTKAQGHLKILTSPVKEWSQVYYWSRRETLNHQKKQKPIPSSRNYNPTLSSSVNYSNPGIASSCLTMPPSSLTFRAKPGGAQEKSEIAEGVNSELEMALNQTPGSDQNSAKGQAGGLSSAAQPNL